jgi:membrane protease YdiL (CAAX protease family)
MNKNGLLFPLILWIAMTIIYGAALLTFGNFEVLSTIYHIGLLALALWCVKGKLKDGLALRRGKVRYGLLIIAGFIGYLLLHTIFQGWPSFALGFDLATFSTIIFAPITEELFWRGAIFQRMEKLQLDYLVLILANAALFALMHIPRMIFLGEPPIYLPLVMSVGFMFAGARYVTKSSIYSTVMHMLENIFTL